GSCLPLIHFTTIFTYSPYTTLFRSWASFALLLHALHCHVPYKRSIPNFPHAGQCTPVSKCLFLTPYLDKISKSCALHAPKMACRSEEHTSELQSRFDLVCRLLLEKK